jgi:hypothetical protein
MDLRPIGLKTHRLAKVGEKWEPVSASVAIISAE